MFCFCFLGFFLLIIESMAKWAKKKNVPADGLKRNECTNRALIWVNCHTEEDCTVCLSGPCWFHLYL